MLRFEPASTRDRTFPCDRSSRDALRRARGELAVVLHKRPTGLSIWQGGRAVRGTTAGDTTTEPGPGGHGNASERAGSTARRLGSGALSREVARAFPRGG